MSTVTMTATPARRYAAIERVTAMAAAQAALQALGRDPVAFAEACGVTLDPWQREVVESRALRILLACSRQSGKSLVAAVLALYTAVYTPRATVLVLSATERQSGELFRKVLVLLSGLSANSGGALSVPTDAETQRTLTLGNGSRIVSLPGTPSTVRSYSNVTLLILDEAAFVDNELYYGTLPMLAVSGGRLILLSSCYGKRGIFLGSLARAGKRRERADPLAQGARAGDPVPAHPGGFPGGAAPDHGLVAVRVRVHGPIPGCADGRLPRGRHHGGSE